MGTSLLQYSEMVEDAELNMAELPLFNQLLQSRLPELLRSLIRYTLQNRVNGT